MVIKESKTPESQLLKSTIRYLHSAAGVPGTADTVGETQEVITGDMEDIWCKSEAAAPSGQENCKTVPLPILQ